MLLKQLHKCNILLFKIRNARFHLKKKVWKSLGRFPNGILIYEGLIRGPVSEVPVEAVRGSI